jgi:L-malate glycosyltransferase
MKVVQLVMSRQYRGAEVFAAQLARVLKQQGIEVYYVSLYRNEGKVLELSDQTVIDLQVPRAGSFNYSVYRKLKKVLKEINPDIVQANAGDTLKYAVWVKLFSNLKFKIVARNASIISQYLRSRWHKNFNRFLYHHADAILSVSQQSQDDLLTLFPACASKSSVIPIGIDLKLYRHSPTLTRDHFNLTHVGGFTFEKNHEGLIRIFKETLKKIPSAKLWLLGDGPLKNAIEQRVKREGLEERIIFLGSQSNIYDYISAAQVLVLPSKIEGLPAVILEAFYCKTPVVAYAVGGIGEIVQQGITGFLVAPGNEGAFAEAVLTAGKSEVSAKIVDRAFNDVTRQFDNRIIGKKFIATYRGFLKR